MTQTPHALFGTARANIDNFERSLALAESNLSLAEIAIGAVPGVRIPDDVRAKIQAFRAVTDVGLSAFLETEGRLAMKVAA